MKKISLIMLAILCLATVASAATVTISTTITFSGTSKNLGGNSYKCVNMGDGSQSESQKPFGKGTGGSLSSWTLLAPGVDGVHIIGASCSGTWSDIGEDAATKKSGSTGASTANGNAYSGSDKVHQVNCSGTMNANLRGSGGQTFCRQNGGTSYQCSLQCGGSNFSSINRGCVSCSGSTSCGGYSSLGAKSCKCFKP